MPLPDNNPTRVAILMAGGAGRRLWPVSGPRKPKPLLRMPGRPETLLEQTVLHVMSCAEHEALPGVPAAIVSMIRESAAEAGREGPVRSAERRGAGPCVCQAGVLISTSAPFAGAIRSVGVVPGESVIVEPVRRDTAGCVALGLAALLARGNDPERVTVGFVNTDALVADTEAYRETIRTAYAIAEESGSLVCTGIRPTRSQTDFGYIEVDSTAKSAPVAGSSSGRSKRGGPASNGAAVWPVARFQEKPPTRVAEQLVANGRCWWNSGMLFGTVAALLRAMKRHAPELAEGTWRAARALAEGNQDGVRDALEALPSRSVDYALLERCDDLLMLAGGFEWDTLDGWDSAYRWLPKDERGNVVVGDCTVENCSGCFVYRDDTPEAPPAIATGLCDMAVVSGAEGLLVAPLSGVRQAALRREDARA